MNKPFDRFLSLDWGTSSFRLRLVDSHSLQPLAEIANKEGVAVVFRRWQQQPGENRFGFYSALVQKHIASLQEKTSNSLQHLPLVVSGMATSTLGMVEVGYKKLPFATDGSDLAVQTIAESSQLPHPVYLISGAKTDDDVMRGEETQVVGCIKSGAEESVIVLPGTHSKHVFVKNNEVVGFRTYMTGEFFQLLSQKSILAASVEQAESLQNDSCRQSFESGVRDGAGFNLLHACFRVRTNQLFQKTSKEQNYHYLSGLLVGAEVHDLVQKAAASLTLVADKALLPLYTEALRLLSPERSVTELDAATAVIRGQARILAQQKIVYEKRFV